MVRVKCVYNIHILNIYRRHCQRAKGHFENSGLRVKVEAMLALLAKSGALYCVVWVGIQLVLSPIHLT